MATAKQVRAQLYAAAKALKEEKRPQVTAAAPPLSVVITASDAAAQWRSATESRLTAVLSDDAKCVCPLIAEYAGVPDVPQWTGWPYDDQSHPRRRKAIPADEHLTVRRYGGMNEKENVCRVRALLDRDAIADVEMAQYANQGGACYRFHFRVRVHVPEESLRPSDVYEVSAFGGPKGPWPLPFGGPTFKACPPGGTIYRLTSTGAVFDLQRRDDYHLRFVRRLRPDDDMKHAVDRGHDAAPAAQAI